MTSITVQYATNRSYDPSQKGRLRFGPRFHPDGPSFYRVGTASVRRPANGDGDYVLKSYDVEPEQPPEGRTKEKIGSAKIFDGLREGMAENKVDVIVYLHGFDNTFESCLERMAEVVDKYRLPPNGGQARQAYGFAFSWPSDGEMVPFKSYHSDREDAAFSGIAMARALLRLTDYLAKNKNDLCEQRIHLVAHSMGNWALRHAVLGLKTLSNWYNLPRIFEHVFLMGADEDADAFESDTKLRLLTQLARSIHVYYASDDGALKISDLTKGNPDRLGHHGPRTMDGIDSRVDAIDCTAVSSTSLSHLNHQYYRLRPEVIADVCAVLAGKPSDSIPGREVIQSGRRFRLKGPS